MTVGISFDINQRIQVVSVFIAETPTFVMPTVEVKSVSKIIMCF